MKRTIITTIATLLLTAQVSGEPDLKSMRLSLEFESAPLAVVLNMIARQHQLNLVVSSDVEGEVTVRLEDVDVATALDAILTPRGYNYYLHNNVIVVKPMETDALDELQSRIITLRYLDPITAKKALEARLSPKGLVVILDKISSAIATPSTYTPNRIMITDYASAIDELVKLVTKLDVRERIILIEAKIIETKVDNRLKVGLNWPSSINAKMSDADEGTSSSSSTDGDTERNAGVYQPQDGRWIWGKLSVGQLNLVLDLLEQQGNSRLISDPRITTIENHEAEFSFTTVIPIQTINRFTEGAATSDIVTFEDKEVGISLKVTPRINEAGTITLDVNPKVEDIIGFSGPPDNQKPITASRSIKTRITVNDGETVALGGLLKEDEIKTVKKVPLLGSIPLIGSLLFTNKSVEKSTTDLIILITPHILH